MCVTTLSRAGEISESVGDAMAAMLFGSGAFSYSTLVCVLARSVVGFQTMEACIFGDGEHALIPPR